MWPALLLTSSAIGLELGLARLKVLALIPATIVLSLSAIGGIAFGLRWGTIALTVIAAVTILQSSYLIGGLLCEASTPHAAPWHKRASSETSPREFHSETITRRFGLNS
jgi:hypothetical protein